MGWKGIVGERGVFRTSDDVVGGIALADVSLSPDRETRVDLGLPDGGTLSGYNLTLTSDGDRWSLT